MMKFKPIVNCNINNDILYDPSIVKNNILIIDVETWKQEQKQEKRREKREEERLMRACYPELYGWRGMISLG